jgi:hypothetical protein
MGIFDVLWEAHWDELAAFFSKGNPPLIVQLLFLNTIIFVWLIVRRMRPKRPPPSNRSCSPPTCSRSSRKTSAGHCTS